MSSFLVYDYVYLAEEDRAGYLAYSFLAYICASVLQVRVLVSFPRGTIGWSVVVVVVFPRHILSIYLFTV